MPEFIRVDGVEELERKLALAGMRLNDLDFQAISAEATRLAQSFVPKRTGRLAASIRGNKSKNRAVVKAGGARLPYAAPINYGWPAHNIEPSEFMQKADREMRRTAPTMVERLVDAALKARGLM